ncbi:MAG: YCF48-related protein [Candidatus Moranbacteria bacterium]|nr:YCF48-related protein [Candidatus Moranbacteria bacterium]
MKKGVVILACATFTLALTGCALTPVASTPGAVQTYPISKSIWISRDGGKSWKDSSVATNKPTVTDINPLSLAMDPNNQNIAYVGLRSGGIMKTTSGGDGWEFLTFKSDKIYGLAVDPNNSQTIYASTVIAGRGKIFKNSAAGATDSWTEIYTAATNGPLVVQMTVDKKNPQTLYAATSDNQVLKSADGGISWRSLLQAQSPVVKIAVDARDGNLVYLLTQNGEAFVSSNGGDKFESLTAKIVVTVSAGSGFGVLETDPTNGKWVYLGGKTGIIRSKDAGDKWESILTLNNPQNSPVGALAINPQNSREIMYGAMQATYKSIDEGKTWTPAQFDVPKPINILEYNPLNPSIIYAGFSAK